MHAIIDDNSITITHALEINEINNLTNNTIKTEDQLNNKTNFNNSYTIYDLILEEYGYKKEIWKIIITSLFLYLIVGYFSTSFASLVLPYQELLSLSDDQVGLLGTLFFISKAIGSLLVGDFTIIIRRDTIVQYSLVFLIVFNCVIDQINNYTFFCIFKITSGILCGVLEIIANNILCEYLPITNRSLTLNTVWVGYSLSQVLINIVMLMIMPNLETKGVAWTNNIFSIIFFIFFIINFFIFKESPRFLILHNMEEEAFETLYKLKEKSYFTNDIKTKLVKEIKEGVNLEKSESKFTKIFDVFSKEFMCFTIITIIVSIGATSMNDGGALLVTLTLKEVNLENKEEPAKNIIINNIIIYSFSIFSNMFYGLISEMKSLGRKKSIFIGITLNILSMSLIVIFPTWITVFMTFFNFFSNVINLIVTYISEVYPTKIRDIGLGWNNFFSYMGCGVMQYLLLIIFDLNWRVPYLFLIGLAIVCLVLICFSPVETMERPLDVEFTKEINEKSEKHEEENEKFINKDD